MLSEKDIESFQRKIEKGNTPGIKIDPEKCSFLKAGKVYKIKSIIDFPEFSEELLLKLTPKYKKMTTVEVEKSIRNRANPYKIFNQPGPFALLDNQSCYYHTPIAIPTCWLIRPNQKILSIILDSQGQELNITDVVIFARAGMNSFSEHRDLALLLGNVEQILDSKKIRVRPFNGNESLLVDIPEKQTLKVTNGLKDLILLSKLAGKKAT